MSRTSLTIRSDDSQSQDNHLLLVGGGPRGIIQATAEVLFICLYQSHFEQLANLGARYRVKTTIAEKQQILGAGGSFCGGQTGMMNTGIEQDLVFPLPLPSSSQSKHHLKNFLSYRRRYENMLTDNTQQYYNEIKSVNIPGAVMFKRSLGPMSATLDGEFDHSRAYLMRKTVGEEEHSTFQEVRHLAKSIAPFYDLQVCESTLVRHLKVRKNGKHVAVVQGTGTGELDPIYADQIRLNMGTTAINPIWDSAVRKLTYCHVMNAFDYRNHCNARHMLDKDGFLNPGVKILSGGTGLSGLDQISVLSDVMNLFEEDDSEIVGYRVTEEARRKYQGAITLISRTPGKVIPPRHGFTFQWLQGTPVIGRTKHLHSLFLHAAGEEVFRSWMDILTANIARATFRTPDQVINAPKTMQGMLRSQFEETKWFLECRRKAGREEKRGNMNGKEYFLKESSRTLYGAWRQSALSLIFGFGLEENVESAQDEMRRHAPLTWKGREFWLFHRAQLNTISQPQVASRVSNMNLFKNFSDIIGHITSAPVEIHSMLHLLFEAGIAKHAKASYSDIRSDGSKLVLGAHEYHELLVSPVFDRNENELVKSLAGQVKPYDESRPTYGEIGKFRRFSDVHGNPLSLEDNGLGGKGFDIEAENGGRSRVGSFAADVNNRASGVSTASSFTLRRMAMAHLDAAKIKKPEKIMDEVYERIKPSEKAYNEEVQKFKVHFEDAFEIWAYLEAIKFAAGDDAELFRVLFDAGLTRSARKDQMRRMGFGGVPSEKQAYRIYKAKLQGAPLFKPPSRDEYLARFVDTTDDEDVLMYNEAYSMAKRQLERNQGKHYK